jgi:fatty acid-binding protein DegV
MNEDFEIQEFENGDFTDGLLLIELYRIEPIIKYLDDRLKPVTNEIGKSNAKVALAAVFGNKSAHAARKTASMSQKQLDSMAKNINSDRWAFNDYRTKCENLRLQNTVAATAYERL